MSNETERLAAELDELSSEGELIHLQSSAYICKKLTEAAALLRAQQPGRWIFVRDRLPEVNTELLIALEGQSIAATGQYTGSDRDVDGWCYPSENRWTGPDGCDPKVVAWQPLPTPPQGATNEG